MKNIIIAGPSRAGKSTLARKINEELNYYVISVDKLVAVFHAISVRYSGELFQSVYTVSRRAAIKNAAGKS